MPKNAETSEISMEEPTKEACRLCLEYPEDDPVPISKSLKMIIYILVPELDLNNCVRPVLCSDCCFCLYDIYNFKTTTCINDEKIKEKVKGLKEKKTIRQTLFGDCENCDKCVKKPMCRFCFDKKFDFKFTDLRPDKTSKDVTKIVASCLPEINISLTTDPFVCPECWDMLQNFYHFKCTCLEVERTFESYREQYKAPKKRLIINEVVEYYLERVRKQHLKEQLNGVQEESAPLCKIESVVSLKSKKKKNEEKSSNEESIIIDLVDDEKENEDINQETSKNEETLKETSIIYDSEQNIEIEIIDVGFDEITKLQEEGAVLKEK